MNELDERLRHAAVSVRDLVERQVSPPPAPAARPRPARAPVVATAVVVLVLLAALLVARERGPGRRVVASGSPTPVPARIVAWQASATVTAAVVLSTQTGRVVRILDPQVALFRGIPSFAVTPDGGTVYYSRSGTAPGARAAGCHGAPVDEIARVGVNGGRPVPVAPGVAPAISADGRYLAYAQSASSSCTSDVDRLVVRDLRSGHERSWRWAHQPPRDVSAFLSWAPDNRHLGFDTVVDNRPAPLLLDTVTARSLDDATSIPHAPGTTWAGFLGTTGSSLGVRPVPAGRATSDDEVVELDGTTGAVRRALFNLPTRLATGNASDGTEGRVRSDASGRSVLAVANSPGGEGVLYRWTEGGAPVVVARNADSAAWIG